VGGEWRGMRCACGQPPETYCSRDWGRKRSRVGLHEGYITAWVFGAMVLCFQMPATRNVLQKQSLIMQHRLVNLAGLAASVQQVEDRHARTSQGDAKDNTSLTGPAG
jgi:hypothetical protein